MVRMLLLLVVLCCDIEQTRVFGGLLANGQMTNDLYCWTLIGQEKKEMTDDHYVEDDKKARQHYRVVNSGKCTCYSWLKAQPTGEV